MARRPPFPTLRERRQERSQRLLTHRAVIDALVSVAGLARQSVRNRAGADVGHLVDVVVRWEGEPYPPVTGIVARVGRRHAFVPIEQVEELGVEGVVLGSARLDLRDFDRRAGEVVLNGDVIDHQLVDCDGVRVVRAADLYLARALGGYRLVGVDVGFQTLLRRLGPARWRARPTPDRVIDWAAIQPFGTESGPMRLRKGNQALQRLRPAELADVLEELGRRERQELLSALDTETAADALEEMSPDELGALLHESTVAEAAVLVARMEPDEAADALRDLDDDRRHDLLAAMPAPIATHLRALVGHAEDSAGGLMTTYLVRVEPHRTVSEVRELLREQTEHRADVDAVTVVDGDGVVVQDVGLFDLLTAAPELAIVDATGGEDAVTVAPGASLGEVVERFIDSRRRSMLVVDDAGRPVGRILADDLVDALAPGRGRIRFPRLLA